MVANQNSSQERGLYPEIDPTPLSSNTTKTTQLQKKLSAIGTGLEITAETRNGARKTTCEIDDKNWIKKQFISSQTFHRTPDERVRKTTAEEQFEPQNLESFDPATQKLYRFHPTTIHTQEQEKN
jgi:hypothetical protein